MQVVEYSSLRQPEKRIVWATEVEQAHFLL